MKKLILGFMNIAQLIDNAPSQLSALGEISTWSLTYSKNHGIYTSDLTPGLALTTFSVTDSATLTDQTLTISESELILKITQACLVYTSSTVPPIDPNDFRSSIQAEFYSEIENLEFGELISASNVVLPAWFTFTTKAGDKNENRIWLADNNFRLEYPEYDITVVSPLKDMNDFLKPWATAVQLIEARTIPILVDEMQIQKNLNPETYIRNFEFNFVNRTNPSQKKKTSWFILVYGEAGNNDDTIKDAIIDELVKNTGQSEEVWQEIFPELFERTEFVILPQWENIAIPNMSTLTSIYSPFINVKDAQTYAKANVDFYSSTWIEENSMTWPVTYKCLSVISVDGESNADDQKYLKDVYPDYIPIPTTDPDFQRMTVNTQNWVHFILQLVISAETVTGTSTLPQGIRRQRRGNLWWVVGTYGGANFLVSQRRNYVS